MIINKGKKIHLLTLPTGEPTRYAMSGVLWTNPDREPHGTLVATNGLSLVALSVYACPNDPVRAILPKAALRAACLKPASEDPTCVITCTDTHVNVDNRACGETRIFPMEAEDGFPAWEQIIPEVDTSATMVRIDAKLMLELAQALGSDEITLQITGEKDPIRVHRCDDTERSDIGVIMPLALGKVDHV